MACVIMVGTGVVSFLGHNWSQLRGADTAAALDGTPAQCLHCRRRDLGRSPLLFLIGAGRWPLPGIVAGLVVVPGSVVCCGPDLPAEPTYTPLNRARYRSGLAVAGPRPPGAEPGGRVALRALAEVVV